MKRIQVIAYQGAGRLPGYEDEEDLIKLGHVGHLFIDEDDPRAYAFRPTDETARAYGSLLARHLKDHNPVPGKVYDDRRYFERAYALSLTRDPEVFAHEADENRLIVYQYTHEFEDEVYQQIRAAVLEWYNETDSTLQYKLPPPTDTADNCATAFRRVGIPCFEDLHEGQLAAYIVLLKEIGSPWHPQGQEDHD